MRRPVSQAIAEHARAFAAGAQPAVPRDAATVLLLRDGAAGLEIYLLRRAVGMAFAGGMYAYPGGGVDPRDGAAGIGWAGPDAAAWVRRLGGSEDEARSLVCAACRETFEECGVLLAGPDADTVVADVNGEQWERARQALESRELGFGALLEQTGLVLRTDLLRAWARWVTPEAEPRRYDARFFVAALPEGQATRDISREAEQVVWARPGDVLAAAGRRDIGLLPPTVETLRSVAAYDDVADVLAAAEGRDVSPVLPRIVVDDGGGHVVLPGEPGYAS